MTERERFKELDRLKKERAKLWKIANNLDKAYWNLLEEIEKLNKKIRKLRRNQKCESS